LHQLRGRVGRGDAQSYCIFAQGSESKDVEERLSILKKSNDGFVIAEEDFRLRGTGDLLGIRQSGDPRFRAADLGRDRDMLRLAGEIAGRVLAEDPELSRAEHAGIKKRLEAYFAAEERIDSL
ncbi:MAG: ATP-dependent DNA helicase RecG, partial [Lachnospiraceae bacterium]